MTMKIQTEMWLWKILKKNKTRKSKQKKERKNKWKMYMSKIKTAWKETVIFLICGTLK